MPDPTSPPGSCRSLPVARLAGDIIPLRLVPVIDPTRLAYMAGTLWLLRK